MPRLVNTLLAMLFAMVALGQEKYYVSTEVSNTSPAVNEPVTITYRLRYKGSGGVFNLSKLRVQPSPPADFDLMDEWVGDRGWGFEDMGTNTLYKYTQVLRPKRKGTFTLPPVEFNWSGKVYKSEEVKIYVGEAPPESTQPETREYFVETSLDRNTVYMGEPVVITLRLYTRRDMERDHVTSMPDLGSFYKQDLALDRRKTVVRVGHRQYYMWETEKYALTPVRGGQQSIGSFEVQALAYFAAGFFGDWRPVTMRTNSVSINVKPLPDKGKPASFTGAVGNFSMKHEISSEQTPADEPITYRITISGDGDFNFVKDPVIELPPDFEVYDPKVTTNISASKTSGSKAFEYLIIPRREGEYVLKPYEFSWFDPKKERYFTASTPEYQIKVTKGTGTTSSYSSGISKEDVALLGQDIRFIKTGPLAASRGIAFGSKAFVALMLAPIVLFIPLLFLKRYRNSRLSDQAVQEKLIAHRQTQRNLAAARRLMKQGDVRGFYRSVQNALEVWLANKLRIPQGDLSKQRIMDELALRGIPAETTTELKTVLDDCELALYAPSAQAAQMQEAWTRTHNVITSLQSHLR